MPNIPLDPNLYQAARTGNIKFFRKFLSGLNLHIELDAFNADPNDEEIIALVANDVNATHPVQPADPLQGVSYTGDTVLHIAVRFRQTTLAKKICQARSSILVRANNKDETPLHYAAQTGNIDLVRYFITITNQGGNRDQLLQKRNREGETALYQAVHQQHKQVVEKLMLEDPHLATIQDNQNISPLYLATMLGSLPIVTCLAQLMPLGLPRRSYIGPDGRTALHAAAESKIIRFVKMILWRQPDLPNAVDNLGYTPLHCVALVNNYSDVKILLERDRTSAYTVDSSGLCPVHIAAQRGHLEMVIELFKHCPESDELIERQGRNFLHLAVEKKRVNIVRWASEEVIKLETAMNAHDYQGNTPLHVAVKAGDPKTVCHLLLSKRVHLNLVNKNNEIDPKLLSVMKFLSCSV